MEKALSQMPEAATIAETAPALLDDVELLLVGGGCAEATPY